MSETDQTTRPGTIPNTPTEITPDRRHDVSNLVGVINQAEENDEIYVHYRTADDDTEIVSGRAFALTCLTVYGTTLATLSLYVDDADDVLTVSATTREPDGLDVEQKPVGATNDEREIVNVDRAARVFVPNPGVGSEEVA